MANNEIYTKVEIFPANGKTITVSTNPDFAGKALLDGWDYFRFDSSDTEITVVHNMGTGHAVLTKATQSPIGTAPSCNNVTC